MQNFLLGDKNHEKDKHNGLLCSAFREWQASFEKQKGKLYVISTPVFYGEQDRIEFMAAHSHVESFVSGLRNETVPVPEI